MDGLVLVWAPSSYLCPGPTRRALIAANGLGSNEERFICVEAEVQVQVCGLIDYPTDDKSYHHHRQKTRNVCLAVEWEKDFVWNWTERTEALVLCGTAGRISCSHWDYERLVTNFVRSKGIKSALGHSESECAHVDGGSWR